MVNLVGVDYVSFGSDMIENSVGHWWDNNTYRRYPEICGGMTSDRHQLAGFPNHSAIPKITDALVRHGYKEGNIQKIMGLNLMRLYRQVFRG